MCELIFIPQMPTRKIKIVTQLFQISIAKRIPFNTMKQALIKHSLVFTMAMEKKDIHVLVLLEIK